MFKKSLLLMLLMAFMAPWAAGQEQQAKDLPYNYGFESDQDPNQALTEEGWSKYFGTSLESNNSECQVVGAAKHTGSYGFRFSSYNTAGENAQYLISPLLNAPDGVIVTFWYAVSNSWGTEKFKVGYSTSSSDISDFTWGSEVSTNSLTWQQTDEYTFPANTKYIAVYYYSNYQYRLYIDDFSFTAPLTGPALSVSDGDTPLETGHNYSFGLATAGDTHTFTLSNPGTEATPISVAHTGSFGAALSANSIPAGGSVTLTVTMPDATGSDVITISSTATTIDDFVINVSGTIRDASKLYEYGFSELPEGWTTTGSWSYSATNGAYTTAWFLNSSLLITPKLMIASGEKFYVEAKGYSTSNTSYQHLQMQYSSDGSTWTNFDDEPSLDPSNWNTFEFTGVPAGSYYIAMNASQANIRMFYGGQLPARPKNVRVGDFDDSSATILWDAFDDEEQWQVSYSREPGNPAVPVNGGLVTATTTPSKEITGLTASTKYYVSVRIDNGDGTYGEWSDEINFTTDCGPIDLPYSNDFKDETEDELPECFSRLNYGDGSYPYVVVGSSYAHSDTKAVYFSNYYSSNNDLMLVLPEIKENVDITQYQLTFWARTGSQWYPNQTFEIGVLTDKTDAASFAKVGDITVPDYSYSEMTPVSFANYTGTGKYIAIKFTSTSTAYIDDISVELLPACEKPGNIEVDNITGRSAELTFESSATLWQVAYSTINNFNPDVNTQCDYVSADENPFTLTGLDPETDYYVRVRANCGTVAEPVYSEWNNTQKTFKTTVLCPAPTALNYSNATAHSLQLYWTAGNDNQDTWELAYSLEENFTPEDEGGNANPGVEIISVQENPYTLGSLEQSKTYYLRVRSDCSGDGKSAWSSQRTAYTISGHIAPSGLAASNISATGADLSWNGSVNNVLHDSYEVYYSTDYTTPGGTPAAGTNYITDITNNTYTLSTLNEKTKYYVWVRDYCGTDGYSAWSEYTSFTTLELCPTPTNLHLITNTTTTATLAWDAVDGQSAWILYYSTNNQAPALDQATDIVSVNTNPYTLTDLTPETTYYAWVRGDCGGEEGQSAWSQVCDFMPSESVVLNLYSDGTATNNRIPFYADNLNSSNVGFVSQFIIPATDMGNYIIGGAIQKLTFYSNYSTATSFGTAEFDVKISEVEDSYFTSNTPATINSATNYSGSLSYSNGHLTITLTKPYIYQGGNLIVEVKVTKRGSYASINWIGKTTTENQSLYKPYSGSNSRYKFVPKTTITYLPAIAFTADGSLNEGSNWSTGEVPSATDVVLINAAATIANDEIAQFSGVTIGTGSITIAEGGQLICNNAPTVTVQKSINAATNWGHQDEAYVPDNWYFIASPLSADYTPTGEMIAGEYDLYRLNPATTMWENYKAMTEIEGDDPQPAHEDFTGLVNGKGYLYANNTGNGLSFTGAIVPFAATKNVTVQAGWNLIGNPFTFNTYVNGSYYKMNEDRTGIEAVNDNAPIAPCTGVVVKADATGNVTFTNTPNRSNSGIQVALAKANVRGNASLDNAIVSFNEGSQLEKFYFMQQNANLYIPQGAEEYAIATSNGQGTMPVNFRANENGQYTLTVNAENVEMNYLHLIDNMTGADIDLLATPTYTFNATKTDYESRFKLVFVSATDNAEGSNDSFAFLSNGQLIIANEGQATLQVVDVMGRILSSETINGSVSKSLNAPAGIYMLRLVNGDNVKVQKMVVR